MTRPTVHLLHLDQTEPRNVTENTPERKDSTRFRMFNHVIDVEQRHLSPTEALVWLTLWRHADTRGVVTIGRKRLAEAIGKSEETISRAMSSLMPRHLERIAGGHTGKVSTYRLYSGRRRPEG